MVAAQRLIAHWWEIKRKLNDSGFDHCNGNLLVAIMGKNMIFSWRGSLFKINSCNPVLHWSASKSPLQEKGMPQKGSVIVHFSHKDIALEWFAWVQFFSGGIFRCITLFRHQQEWCSYPFSVGCIARRWLSEGHQHCTSPSEGWFGTVQCPLVSNQHRKTISWQQNQELL